MLLRQSHVSACRFKQQGEAAEQADNVFHPLTYEGAVNIDGLVSAQERAALESQINEFGQCPRQLFARPHPPRLACPAVAEWCAGCLSSCCKCVVCVA